MIQKLRQGIERRKLERLAGSYRAVQKPLSNYKAKYGQDDFYKEYVRLYGENWAVEVQEGLR